MHEHPLMMKTSTKARDFMFNLCWSISEE